MMNAKYTKIAEQFASEIAKEELDLKPGDEVDEETIHELKETLPKMQKIAMISSS